MKESVLSTSDSQGHTIRAALELLESVASESADRVKDMLAADYKDLKDIISEAKPGAKRALGELKGVTQEAMTTVDRSARRNAWTYIGVVATISAVAGYFFGRRQVCD